MSNKSFIPYPSIPRYRDHDTLQVVANGGRVVRNTDVDNFSSDVSRLIGKLRSDEIEGFVFDKWTLAYVMLLGGQFLTQEDMDFLVSDTTRREIGTIEDHHSYGILVRERELFDYFHVSQRHSITYFQGVFM